MFHYIVRQCRNGTPGWIAMAKKEPFVTDGDGINEPGDLWFCFGVTEDEARAKIKAEVRAALN